MAASVNRECSIWDAVLAEEVLRKAAGSLRRLKVCLPVPLLAVVPLLLREQMGEWGHRELSRYHRGSRLRAGRRV